MIISPDVSWVLKTQNVQTQFVTCLSLKLFVLMYSYFVIINNLKLERKPSKFPFPSILYHQISKTSKSIYFLNPVIIYCGPTAIYCPNWFPASCLQRSHFPDIHAPFKHTNPLGKIFQWLSNTLGQNSLGKLVRYRFLALPPVMRARLRSGF